MGEHAVCLVGAAHPLLFGRSVQGGREVRGYVLVARVGCLRLKVAAEHVARMLRLELLRHLRLGGVVFDLDLVPFHQLDGVEEGVFYLFPLQSDADIVDDVRERTFRQHARPPALFGGGGIGALHQLFDTFVFEGGDGNDGHAQRLFQLFGVDGVAALVDGVDHVQRHHHGHVDLQQLRGEV